MFHLRTFVETGTCFGDMVRGVLRDFDDIYSVELDSVLFMHAQARFRRHPHVRIISGDSAEVLGRLVPQLASPALFWLDGHYSGGVTAHGSEETPVLQELQHIFAGTAVEHVALVDDARCFGHSGWPSLNELRATILRLRPDRIIAGAEDVVRVTPPHGISCAP